MPSENTEAEDDDPPPHPISAAIDAHLHAVRDIEACARMFVPMGAQLILDTMKETGAKINELVDVAGSEDEKTRTEAQAEFDRQHTCFERLRNSKLHYQLEKSLFVGLFTCYDGFFGDLLGGLFSKKNELFKKLDQSVSFGDVMGAESIDELKATILDQFISDTRRKSYEDQFTAMEGFFGMSLRKFPNYPAFIESSQRRHLFTHCEGSVSSQYVSCCKAVGYEFENVPNVGDRLDLGPDYFITTCHVVGEVGVKLAHTLWRKLFPEELEIADKHLSETIFSLLQNERWEQAIVLGEFAKSQNNVFDREREKIYLVNYCIALKADGKGPDAFKLLEAEDWSDSAPDYKLAKAVLLDDIEESIKLMKVIGKKGELISEHAYHTWPLFRDVRGNDLFREAYQSIYGYSFVEELKREAAKTQDQIAEQGGADQPSAAGDLKSE